MNIHTIIETREIVFDAPGIPNPAMLHAEPAPSIAILRLLHANQIEKPERWCDKKSISPKPSLRSRRQARVYKGDWYSARVRFRAMHAGRPVAGAVVRVASHWVRTGAAGTARMTLRLPRSGRLRAIATRADLRAAVVTLREALR